METVRDGLLSLEAGGIDAFLATSSTASYLITELGFSDLDVVGFADLSIGLGFGVARDQPLLLSILNKGLASLTPLEMLTIRGRWLVGGAQPQAGAAGTTRSVAGTVGLVAGIALLVGGLLWLMSALAGDRLPLGLETGGQRLIGALAAGLFLSVVGVGAWLGTEGLERQTRQAAGESSHVIVRSLQWAVDEWYHGARALTEREAAGIGGLAERLLAVPPTARDLLASPALAETRGLLQTQLDRHHLRGFFLIAPDFTNLASMRDANLGWRNLIAEERPALLRKAFGGKTVFVAPLPSDVPLSNGAGATRPAAPTMFVASPVRAADGRVIAVLALRFDPDRELSPVLATGRLGQSGETYAFDGDGRLLAGSRFTGDLRGLGILAADQDVPLGMRLSDPGGDLVSGHRSPLPRPEQPLTRMAAEATAGRGGVDTEGYRDYRGVRVLGAWVWDDQLEIGLATEIDEDEALARFRQNRALLLAAVALLVLLTSTLMGILVASGERANRTLSRARDEWERLAEAHSASLERERGRLQTILDVNPATVYSRTAIEPFPATFIAENVATQFGFSPSDFLDDPGFWAGRIHPDDAPRIFEGLGLLFEHVRHAHEYRWQAADGRWVWVHDDVVLTRDAEGNPLEIVGTWMDITERKETERAIQASEQRSEAMLAALPDMVFRLRTNGIILDFRANDEQQLALPAERMIGAHLTDILPLSAAETILRGAAESTHEPGRVVQIEYQLELDQSRAFEGRLTASGEAEVVAIVRDVTDWRVHEAALQLAREQAESAAQAKSQSKGRWHAHCCPDGPGREGHMVTADRAVLPARCPPAPGDRYEDATLHWDVAPDLPTLDLDLPAEGENPQ